MTRPAGCALAVAATLMLGCGRGPFWQIVETARCTSVDFVFVIDNSESMERHQRNLRSSFGPFIAGINETLEDVGDYHVGVVTTDSYRYNPDGCGRLGALVTETGGPGTTYQACGPFAASQPYMTEADNLTEAFDCAASVGISGERVEKPMEALQNVINPNQHWYDDCNGDFVRDDSLLVAVTITDEWDGPGDPQDEDRNDGVVEYSLGTPEDWYDGVVRAKGAPGNAVVVSLLNEANTGCTRDLKLYDGQNIADFTNRFPHGFVGGICEDDYGAIFETAVEEIDEACSNYRFVDPD